MTWELDLQKENNKPFKGLNIGCGKDTKEGYLNLDIAKLPGVDLVHDLNKYPYPFKKNEFDKIYCDNVLEHLDDIIKPIEEIWRITKHKGEIEVMVPIATGIGATADPTHKQFYSYTTFNYFRPEDTLNYYSKARFKIKERKILFHPYLKPFEWLINFNEILQKIYYTFFPFIIPASSLYFKLEVVKR